jgi:ATP-dependent Clp protease ATP-binding subunit ClpA
MASFDKVLREIRDRGADEARADGSENVEAQHLLLALAAYPDAAVQGILASAGLDRDAIRGALDREFEHSLSAAGVSLAAFDLPRPDDGARQVLLGTSAKLALERGFRGDARRGKYLQPANILIGILRAQTGTVPRALALAGVDQASLVASTQQALDGERK